MLRRVGPGGYAVKLEAAAALYAGASESLAPRVLRKGDRGADVMALQVTLGIQPDGDFGPITEAAVRRLQAGRGLGPRDRREDDTRRARGAGALAGRVHGGARLGPGEGDVMASFLTLVASPWFKDSALSAAVLALVAGGILYHRSIYDAGKQGGKAEIVVACRSSRPAA